MGNVLDKALFRLAAPFFLSVLVFGAATRWIISGSFSGAEKAIAYFVSAATACVTISIPFTNDEWPSYFEEWLAALISVVVLLPGAYLVITKSKKRTSREFSPVIAIQVAYLANCLMCLVAFWANWEVGAYFALSTAAVYLFQIALFSAQKNEVSDRGREGSVP
jgi:hypothetical protein